MSADDAITLSSPEAPSPASAAAPSGFIFGPRPHASVSLMLQPAGPRPRVVEKGERHSGNNFLQEVLDKSFDVNPGGGGGCETSSAVSREHFCCWTHGRASDDCAVAFAPAPPTVYVVLVRNPYAWLLAMHHQPYEYDGYAPVQFSSFLRSRFAYAPSPMYDGAAHHSHENPVQLWRSKVESYLSLRTPMLLVRHEELYDEATLRAKLETLVSQHSVPRRAGLRRVVYPDFSTTESNNNHNREFTRSEFDAARAYEEEQRWTSAYSQADIDWVNSQLDAAHMRRLGFALLTSAPPPQPAATARRAARVSRLANTTATAEAAQVWAAAAAVQRRTRSGRNLRAAFGWDRPASGAHTAGGGAHPKLSPLINFLDLEGPREVEGLRALKWL